MGSASLLEFARRALRALAVTLGVATALDLALGGATALGLALGGATAPGLALGFAVAGCGPGDAVDLGSNVQAAADAGPASLDAAPEAAPDSVIPLHCAPHPSACGYPDDTNTGPPAGTALTPSGPLVITTDGAVVSNLDVSGGITVAANDVVIRNVRVTLDGGADPLGTIAVGTSGKNTVIEDSVIAGVDRAHYIQIAVFVTATDGSARIRRVNAFNCSQCITMASGTIEDSYVHDVAGGGPQDVYHGCNGIGLVVHHDTLFSATPAMSTVYLDPVSGRCANLVLDGNLIAGGQFALSLGGSPSSNLRVTTNRFSALYFPKVGSDGLGDFARTDPGNVWSGNFSDDTGDAIP